jgi:hypothetical protein
MLQAILPYRIQWRVSYSTLAYLRGQGCHVSDHVAGQLSTFTSTIHQILQLKHAAYYINVQSFIAGS